MAKFMNAELIAIRDNLECGHCKARFHGSDSQAWKVKYEKLTVYCSTTCRSAAARQRMSKPIPNCGPCKTCGEHFSSRKPKPYCSMRCYIASDQFQAMQRANSAHGLAAAAAAREAKPVEESTCLECGVAFPKKYGTKSRAAKKYCSQPCYRAHKAKAFDRWVANPQTMSLPQCYDEFLSQGELQCVVDGCSWRGQHLSNHMVSTHGVRASEFKRATGFNLSTGVVAAPVAKALRERPVVGVALAPDPFALVLAREAQANNKLRYVSLEGREHAVKGKAQAMLDTGPARCCRGCGAAFIQSTPMGRALYCTRACRTEHYAALKQAAAKQRIRQPDGTFRWA